MNECISVELDTKKKYGLYYSTFELSKIIDVHSHTIYTWVEKGMPTKAGRHGSKYLFDLNDVLNWLKIHKKRYYDKYVRKHSDENSQK